MIDGFTNKVIDTIPGFSFRPRELAINPMTNMIYVGNEGNQAGTTLAVINGSMNTIVKNITVGLGPTGVAVNPTTNRIYTANGRRHRLGRQWSTNTVIATVPVGLRPQELAIKQLQVSYM